MRSLLLDWSDPGPCPVDDTPHTACCSADYAPGVLVTKPLRPLRGIDPQTLRPREEPPPETTTSVEFTSATYDRKKHGPRRRAR